MLNYCPVRSAPDGLALIIINTGYLYPKTHLFFMPVRVICFNQEGCIGCEEQVPINHEVQNILGIEIEVINAVKNPEYISKYGLKVTPTIVIIDDDELKEKMEGVVHRETLEETIKKYL